MAVEWCYLSVGDVLLWRWSSALWGARGVLCRGKEQCFTGDDTPVIQSFICGEKREGVPPWGLTNLIRCDISEVANTIFLDVIILIILGNNIADGTKTPRDSIFRTRLMILPL